MDLAAAATSSLPLETLESRTCEAVKIWEGSAAPYRLGIQPSHSTGRAYSSKLRDIPIAGSAKNYSGPRGESMR